MNQTEKRLFLIRALLDEQPRYRGMEIPADEAEQRRMLRSLFNIRMPGGISDEFLSVQDEYLREETRQKGVTALAALTPAEPGIYLWQGDITTLACDAIVNAANSGMTGCYQPCHSCIDNCIHTYAGVQLRNACAGIMERQGHEAPNCWKRIGEDKWVIMYDIYSVNPHNFGFVETTDFKTFTPLGRLNEGVMKANNFVSPKHGSIIPIKLSEAKRLEEYYAK